MAPLLHDVQEKVNLESLPQLEECCMCRLFVCDLVAAVLTFTCAHMADICFERTNGLQKYHASSSAVEVELLSR